MMAAQGKAAEAAALGSAYPTLCLPFFLLRRAGTWASTAEQEKRESPFWARYPRRRSFLACPGLLSYRPYGTSVWLALLA